MKTKKYYYLVIIFIGLLLSNSLIGQSIPHYFYKYKTQDGLSNNTIFCSIQDSYGFIWFGTKDGLNRFDGHNFHIFGKSYADDVGLGSNFIHALAEDKNKRLWVGTDNGIYYTDKNSNSFILLNPFFKEKEIYDINIDKNNVICFLSNGELYTYDINRAKIYKKSSRKDFVLSKSAKDLNGDLFFGSNNGKIFKLTENKLKFICDLNNHIKKQHPISIQALAPIDNAIIIGTSKYGVLKWNSVNNTVTSFFTDSVNNQNLFVRDILINHDDNYWYATENGLYIHNTFNNTYSHYKKELNNKWGISDNAIYNILKDKENGIWLGTYFSGINYFHPNNNLIEKIYPTGNSNNIQGNIVRAINQDKYDNIWIGTEDAGFTKWDRKNQKFQHYSTKNQTIGNDNVHGLLCIDDKIWVSTFFNGVDIFDAKNNITEKHIDRNLNAKNNLQSNFLNFLYQTKNGNIYASTRGFYKYKSDVDNFVAETKLPTNIIYTSIYEDIDNNLWLGTYRNGLFFYNPEKGIIKQYLKQDKQEKNIPHNRVNYIYQDSDHKIWIATDEGIAYLEKSTDNFIKLNTSYIKLGNIIYGIIEDEQKNLWISSSNGLLRYNLITQSKRVFNTESGILSMQFNNNSAFKDKDKNIYFGSTEGLISFNPIHLNSVKFPDNIPLYITNFQLQEDELKNVIQNGINTSISIPFTEQISLKHDESSFIISFAALLFQAPKSITYQYIMEGLDKHWTTIYDNRKVYFTKLSPGNYTFKVRAKDPNGNSIQQIKTLKIKIAAPWYVTTYAIIAYFILILSIVIFIYNYYVEKIKLKNREEMLIAARIKDQELFQSKMNFFTIVAHEIRTPLTLIKAPLEKLISTIKSSPKEEKLLDMMHRNTEKLIKLSTQILDFRKTEIKGYALNLSTYNIEILFSKIYLDFISTFKSFKKEVQYNSEKDIIANIDIEAFELICNNLLSNALKYSDKLIIISLNKNLINNTFMLKVKNDGDLIHEDDLSYVFEPFMRGRHHKKTVGTGLGLALTKSMIEKHGGLISYSIDESNLNTFEVVLPVVIK